MNQFSDMFRRRKPVLIMSLPANDPTLCEAAFDAGADAVKVHINVEHRASGAHFGRLEEERAKLETMLARNRGPIGLVIGGSLELAALDAQEAVQLPIAFISAYAHHMPPSVLGARPLMAACDGGYSPAEIHQMSQMGAAAVEASIIPGSEYGQPLSLRDLLQYASIVRNAELPVVIPTQRAITPQDVPALVQAGVSGLMIGAVVTGKDRESIRRAVFAFRKAIESV